MKLKIKGMKFNEFCDLAKTRSATATLYKFGFTGKKGYPTSKGKKYILKESFDSIIIKNPNGLIEAILKHRSNLKGDK